MHHGMLFNFANVLIFLVVGLGFVFVSLTLGKLLRPHVPTVEKLATYECGELPTQDAWFNFNNRFYIIALLFLIFDVEIAFMFPIGAVFKQWIHEGAGGLALAEIGSFVFILILGLVYAWVKGDLDWVKKLKIEGSVSPSDIVTKASKI